MFWKYMEVTKKLLIETRKGCIKWERDTSGIFVYITPLKDGFLRLLIDDHNYELLELLNINYKRIYKFPQDPNIYELFNLVCTDSERKELNNTVNNMLNDIINGSAFGD